MKTAPYGLLRAKNLVLTDPGFNTLKNSERLVLFSLVGFVSLKNPTDAIYAKKETIAKSIGKSSPTVWRALGALVKKGFLNRRDIQSRHDLSGRFGSSLYSISLEALTAIGLAPTKDEREPRTNQPLPASELTRKTKDKVPEDLQLLKPSLSDGAIFKLMGMATKAHKKLGDIVAAKQQAIKKLRGPQLYALLSFFIKRDEDYATQAKSIYEEDNKKKKQNEDTKKMNDFCEKYNGKQFKLASSLFTLEAKRGSPTFIVEHKNGHSRWIPLSMDFVKGVLGGSIQVSSDAAGESVSSTTRSAGRGIADKLKALRQVIASSK